MDKYFAGNVDPGEDEYSTCKREFLEEVYSIEDTSADQKQEIELAVQSLFKNGIEVYKGYVDDPRNTGITIFNNEDDII